MQNKYDDMDYLIYDSMHELKESDNYDERLINKINCSEKEHECGGLIIKWLSNITKTKKIAMSFVMSGVLLFLLSVPKVAYYTVNFDCRLKYAKSIIEYKNNSLNSFINEIKKYFGE